MRRWQTKPKPKKPANEQKPSKHQKTLNNFENTWIYSDTLTSVSTMYLLIPFLQYKWFITTPLHTQPPLIIAAVLWRLLRRWLPKQQAQPRHYLKVITPKPVVRTHPKNRKKDPWVINKIIYLYAISGAGYGTVATMFENRYGHLGETVSKSFVGNVVRANTYRIQVLRRKIKHKPPRPTNINRIWAMDLTQVSHGGENKLVLGIIEHGTRLSICLNEIQSKHSVRLILELCKAIRKFGMPRSIRTDNEACFNSKIFRLALKLLGIRKQTSDVACPWQNGRIERFFGTFKERWKKLDFSGCPDLQTELLIYQAWYNHVRPHQNLGGLTPWEAWRARPYQRRNEAQWYSAWQGVLCGYYFPD